ncbi:MAG TPA: deoxyribonuclease IV [Candidatus Kapabacteria bacterium]
MQKVKSSSSSAAPKSAALLDKPLRDAPLLGAHVSASGGIVTAFDRAELLGINTFQLFVKNNKQWFAREELSKEQIAEFRSRRKKWKQKGPIVAHACYLLNLGSSDPAIQERSRDSFLKELIRADAVGVDHFVFHPGSHGGMGEESAIVNIANALDHIHEKTPKVKTKTVLEITAGQGSAVGYTFGHLEAIIGKVKQEKRVAVCLDTCHLFAAGYDLRTEETWERTLEEFERRIGFEKLVCVHTNDSKKDFGSHVDRHEHIGKGKIGLEGFRLLMNDSRFEKIPKILETPKDENMTEDYVNLGVLKNLIA